MRFLHPDVLWLLLALPLLGLGAWWGTLRRRAALRRFAGGLEQMARFNAEVSPHLRVTKAILLGAGLAGLIVAAARPQWGTRLEEITRRGIDVAVVLDTSLSMAAQDVAPDRIGQARHEIATLLGRLDGDRVALITFAGRPTLATPLTLDHGAVRLFLDAVQVESVQVPGTALAEALDLALAALTRGDQVQDRSRAIVLFSDGEDHEGGIDDELERLKDAGVAVFAVGCGSSRGAPIPLADSSGYKKDREGKVVTTRLDEAVLERLALETGGRYDRASPAESEVDDMAKALAGMDAREYGSVLRARYEERFQVPLVLGLLALLAETLIGDRRRSPAEHVRGRAA